MEIELADTDEVLTLDESGELSDGDDSSFEDCDGGIYLRQTVTGEVQMLGVADGSASILARW